MIPFCKSRGLALALAFVASVAFVLPAAAKMGGGGGGFGGGGGKMGMKKGEKEKQPEQSPQDGDAESDGPNPEVIGAFMPTKANFADMRSRGFYYTGLKAVFPDGITCVNVTSPFASQTRTDGSPRSMRYYVGYHGGMDLPTDPGTPLLAIADGTVVHINDGSMGIGGIGIMLQHSPEDTGLGVWTYSEYKHIPEIPDIAIGTRVKMGQQIAVTGNSGTTGGHYGDEGLTHLHLTAFYSESPDYKISKMLIPIEGRWMDLMAFFAKAGTLDGEKLKELPDDQKMIAVPFITKSGRVVPENTKVVWPYACQD